MCEEKVSITTVWTHPKLASKIGGGGVRAVTSTVTMNVGFCGATGGVWGERTMNVGFCGATGGVWGERTMNVGFCGATGGVWGERTMNVGFCGATGGRGWFGVNVNGIPQENVAHRRVEFLFSLGSDQKSPSPSPVCLHRSF